MVAVASYCSKPGSLPTTDYYFSEMRTAAEALKKDSHLIPFLPATDWFEARCDSIIISVPNELEQQT